MSKHVVLSVNDNPDYMYFVPLAFWAWRKIGWSPVLLYTRTGSPSKATAVLEGLLTSHILNEDRIAPLSILDINDFDGYRSDTVTQISRLYAACIFRRGTYLMTGDIDMIPLSDYWQERKGITVYGFDLTGYTQYPICYIGMYSESWIEAMKLRINGEVPRDFSALIKGDLDSMPNAKSGDFYKYWFTDQELITQRLKPFNPTIINRGQVNGFARGRVDRGNWHLKHREFIDAHLHHQIHHRQNDWKYLQTLELLERVWPDEDFTWYKEYHQEFQRLTGHG